MNFDLNAMVAAVSKTVVALAPVAEEAATALGHPEIAKGIDLGAKLVQAAQDGSTTAQALVTQIQTGTPPEPAVLLQWEQDNTIAYIKSHNDLAAAIAASADVAKGNA